MKILELAEKIGAKVFFPDNLENHAVITGFNGLEEAQPGQVSFLTSEKYLEKLAQCKASAVILNKEMPAIKIPQLIHKNPYFAFGQACAYFFQNQNVSEEFQGKISPQANFGKNITLGKNTTIYPNVTICDGANIGDGVVLFSGVFIGKNSKVGNHSEIRSNVVIEHHCEVGEKVLIHAGTVVGADGFGFAPGEQNGRYNIVKIPQIGIVIIDDNVEIGAGCTIDRGAFGPTRIGKGTKIDSSVHVGHNVEVGEFSMLCGGVSVAGSVKIGRRVILAGQVGVSHGVEICDGVIIAGRGGVTKSVTAPGEYAGFPLVTIREWRREIVNIRRIEKIDARVKNLENKKL